MTNNIAAAEIRRPSRDAIALRVCEIFQSRRGHDGCYEEDWLLAEAELLQRVNAETMHLAPKAARSKR